MSDAGRDAGDSTAAVCLRGVTREFTGARDRVAALGPIDLSVDHGRFVSLLGPSGCGKSTLLNLVAGLLAPSSGEVRVAGRAVVATPPDVGMMMQNPVLLPWRTAIENVLLPIEVSAGRRGARAAVERARDLLETVGLVGAEHRYPNELSGGMQQRVAVCRMLISDPTVLLLDEPFGSLDEITRELLNLELERIFTGRTTTALLVTHNIQEAVFLSDTVVVLTAAPGRVAGVLDVEFPRPRDPDLVTSAEFQSLVADARRMLNLGTGRGAGPPEGAP